MTRQRIILAGLGVLALLTLGGVIMARQNGTAAHTANAATKSRTRVSTPPSDKASDGTATRVNTPSKTISQAASTAVTAPATAACKLLGPSIARQILGASAQVSTPGDTSSLQAADTTLSACAYSGDGGTMQLVVRAPSGSLGTSGNDIMFGSGRPAGAKAVQGYGQSAFWDPSKHTFNILASNTWYVITRSTNTQSDAEAVAKLLEPGF